MRTSIRKGFTLVEILIVVVILGILAAIVVPQFTSASQDAIKSSLKSQLQTIGSQVELYRVKNSGRYPTLGAGQPNDGWGDLVASDYLKSSPVNGFTGQKTLVTGGSSVADVDSTATIGWTFDGTTYEVFAAGYDSVNNALKGEAAFVAPDGGGATGGSGGTGGTGGTSGT